MRDLDKALADISAIRSQIAAGTAFRGYGPAVVAATGGLALITAVFQFLWLDDPTGHPLIFFSSWAATAFVSGGMIWIEMQARSRRHHSGLSDAMILQAVEQFLPVGVAGASLAVVLWKFAPETLWMLPGLWQVVFSLGVFASCRSLPRGMFAVGVWYLVAGLVTLAVSSSAPFSPLAMAVPFGIGQFLMAFVIWRATGEHDGQI